MVLQACIFEIVTAGVDRIPVPARAFLALGLPVEERNFRYTDMLYTDGRRKNQWGRDASVPDVSRPETKLWLQMPGSRTMQSPLDRRRWYYANTPGPKAPDGLGDEETIRAIWAADSAK